jgi:hypothetical protein
MSTETITHCDRCRETIAASRVVLRVEAGASPLGWPIDHAIGRSALDLCPPCCEALAAWLKVGATPAEETLQ